MLHVEHHRPHVVAREGEVAECPDRRQAARILRPQLAAQQLLLQFERAQVGVLARIGRQTVRSGQHLVAQRIELAGDLDRHLLGNRKIHFQLQFGQADRRLGLENRRPQVAQLHPGRQEIVLRGQPVVVFQLRILDRTPDRGFGLAQHRERLLGQQNIIIGLAHLRHEGDARRARRLDGRGHLRVVELHRAVDLRREERQRGIYGTAQRRIGIVAEREAFGHLLHDELVVDLPRHVDLREQIPPRLTLHVVVAAHLQIGHLDGRVLAQGEIDRLVERQPQLRRGTRKADGQQAENQKKSFHRSIVVCHCSFRNRFKRRTRRSFMPTIGKREYFIGRTRDRSVSGNHPPDATPSAWRFRAKRC